MQMRHEYKHRLNNLDYVQLASRLRAVLPHDRYAVSDISSAANIASGYRVRSLYFDTPDDRALREKISGVDRREKFRVRRYPGNGEHIALEKKIKLNGLCNKTSAVLTAQQYSQIEEGDVEWMTKDGRPLISEFYSKLRGQLLLPKVIVDYFREPLVYAPGNIRITFDTDIRSASLANNFLSDDIPLLPASEEIVILEVKYDEYIPDFIVNLLQVGSRRAAACSKYAIAREYG